LTPENQGCCGIPVLAAGDRESFNRLVDHHIGLFHPNDFDYLVTGCATCTATIKKIWPSMAEVQSIHGKKDIMDLAEKTYDISEFLVKIMGVSPERDSQNPDAAKRVVTYHDPCHLRKSLKIYKEPRTLIRASASYRFTEMPEAEVCCGMGGSFSLNHYGISTAIGLKKIENIRDSGASIVATTCPACMIQIKHVVEIYSDGLLSKKEQKGMS
jgi:glycolate oxidase iron-sulfur subunit